MIKLLGMKLMLPGALAWVLIVLLTGRAGMSHPESSPVISVVNTQASAPGCTREHREPSSAFPCVTPNQFLDSSKGQDVAIDTMHKTQMHWQCFRSRHGLEALPLH